MCETFARHSPSITLVESIIFNVVRTYIGHEVILKMTPHCNVATNLVIDMRLNIKSGTYRTSVKNKELEK